MTLTFTIENETNLPDGGPVSMSISGKRGFDVGRDTHLDWTLPDPDLVISGKHCEVRFHDGDYWLHDLSTNGTFINGSLSRMVEPHRLRNGDRLSIGRYIIAVTLDGAGEDAPLAQNRSGSGRSSDEWWLPEDESPPPIDPRELRPPGKVSVSADFLDWVHEPQGFVHLPDVPKEDRSIWQEEADWIKPMPSAVRHKVAPDLQEPAPLDSPPPPPPVAEGRQGSPSVAMERLEWDVANEPIHDPIYDSPTGPALGSRFLRLFAESAGLPADALAHRDPDEFASLLGSLMNSIASDMMQLLRARHEAKKMARGRDQTMIEANANNPLKFSPSPEDALRIMFGPPTPRYLDAGPALRQAFDDLKRHQISTFSAMQGAAKMLVEDLDPTRIEADLGSEGGLANILGSRKSKLWDSYVARWTAKAKLHDDGLLGAFMFYFPQCYDRGKAD